MIPDLNFFGGKSSREYEGKMYYRYFSPFDCAGKYRLIFRFISTNSPYEQTIFIGMHYFEGTIWVNGLQLKKLKQKKRHSGFTLLQEDADPDGRITVDFEYKGGMVFIQSDMLGWFTDLSFQRKELVNTAMIGEKLNDNTYRFYCNDKEYDDDFDDLIFEMEIREIN